MVWTSPGGASEGKLSSRKRHASSSLHALLSDQLTKMANIRKNAFLANCRSLDAIHLAGAILWHETESEAEMQRFVGLIAETVWISEVVSHLEALS
jgi:hypothetical protein